MSPPTALHTAPVAAIGGQYCPTNNVAVVVCRLKRSNSAPAIPPPGGRRRGWEAEAGAEGEAAAAEAATAAVAAVVVMADRGHRWIPCKGSMMMATRRTRSMPPRPAPARPLLPPPPPLGPFAAAEADPRNVGVTPPGSARRSVRGLPRHIPPPSVTPSRRSPCEEHPRDCPVSRGAAETRTTRCQRRPPRLCPLRR